MAQFDVYRLADGQLVVDLQTDLIGIDATRLVAPLGAAGCYAVLPGLTPVVDVAGQMWIVRIQEMAAVSGAVLKDPIGSLAAERSALTRAMEILTQGV